MHVDEEVRLLEEMAEVERYFEHVFNNFENDGIDMEIVIVTQNESFMRTRLTSLVSNDI